MGTAWYVAKTEPRAEFLAAAELGRDGFEVLFPRLKAVNPRPGHPETPLFPGYLFIRWDPAESGWPTFRGIHRVIGWVSYGDEVPSIPDDAIDDLMERLETVNSRGGLIRRFLPGETVRVASGKIEGLAQVLEEAKHPQSRTKVLLSFMGRLVQAQIPWSDLHPVDEDTPTALVRPPRRSRGRGRPIRGFGSRALTTV